MASLTFRSFFLVSLCFKLSIYSTFSQPNFVLPRCYGDTGFYSDDSAFKTNLDSVFSQISSNTNIDYGYYNFSAGDGPNRANAIALCRGDLPIDDCRSCVYNAAIKISQSCPNQTEAVGLYDACLLRYSNRSISSNGDIPTLYARRTVPDVNGYNQALRSLLERLRDEAASGSSTLKFATGSIEAPSFQTIYGLLQCAPDLSKLECEDCLNRAIRSIPSCCNGRGVRMIPAVCILWYKNFRFYSEPSSLPPPPLPSSPPPSLLSPQAPPVVKENDTSPAAIVIVLPIVGALIVISLISICIWFRRKRRHVGAGDVKTESSLQLDFETSEKPRIISPRKISSEKGKLSDGQIIAVKRLSGNSAQGDVEFRNELLLLAKLQHRNLVRLLGFCLQRNERILVYEFVPNTSLDRFIFAHPETHRKTREPQRDSNPAQRSQPRHQPTRIPPPPPRIGEKVKENGTSPAAIVIVLPIVGALILISLISICIWFRRKRRYEGAGDVKTESSLQLDFETISLDRFIFDPVKRHDLPWQNRFEIISRIARGILFLHEDSRLRIIHRDLKASNVLLDANLRPKIANFGLAKLFESDLSAGNTSMIAGTFGYMAPEYLHQGVFSVKSDVYSFSVIVLEIVSGRSQNRLISSTEHLLGYAWRNWKEGKLTDIVDPLSFSQTRFFMIMQQ